MHETSTEPHCYKQGHACVTVPDLEAGTAAQSQEKDVESTQDKKGGRGNSIMLVQMKEQILLGGYF